MVSLGLFLFLATSCVAQVKITIPERRYGKRDEIHAKIENAGSRPVTFCSSFEGVGEITPSPFWVQRSSNGKWSTLLLGTDVGNDARMADVLTAGKSIEFLLRVNISGRMRLRLNYWRGSIPNLDCHAPPKDLKLVTSDIFTIE